MLSDCFNSTGSKSHFWEDLKATTMQHCGVKSALDIFQKYRFCEHYKNLFWTQMFPLEFLGINLGKF